MAKAFVRAALLLLRWSSASMTPSGLLEARDVAPLGSGGLPQNWSYFGCYLDMGTPRTLNEESYTDSSNMTNEACITFCQGKNYTYAGVEFSQECYCGNFFTTNNSEPITDCSMGCSGNSSETCGGSNRMSIFWNGKRPPPPPVNNPGPPGWAWQGCYTEGSSGRALNTTIQVATGSSNMSVLNCLTACVGFTYAGTEYADECYCGNSIMYDGANSSISNCVMTCAGNSSEFCGGSGILDLYMVNLSTSSSSSSTRTSLSSTPSSSLSGSTSSSSSNSSTLSRSTSASSSSSGSPSSGRSTSASSNSSGSPSLSMSTSSSSSASRSSSSSKSISASSSSSNPAIPISTPLSSSNSTSSRSSISTSLSSISSSSSSSSTLMSTSSRQSISNSSMSTSNSSIWPNSSSALPSSASSSNFSISSTSESTATSGTTTSSSSTASTVTGPVHVPTVGPYTWIGCYSDAIGNRALNALSEVSGSTMSVEVCAAFCSGYLYFGVEFSQECYCDNTIHASGVLESATDCSMLCAANRNEFCGGSNRLDVYQRIGNSNFTFTPTGTSSSQSTITSSTSIVSGPTTLPSGWKYAGCWVDEQYGRIIQYEQPDNPSLTIESCVNICASQNYTVAGMEFSIQCFCGNEIFNAGSLSSNQGDCSMPCGGNSFEMCGAGNRLSVYNIGSLTILGLPVTQTSGIDGWIYRGCRTDSISNRTLPWQIILPNNNTAATCLGLCKEYGYTAGAMEWNEECYCGDPTDRAASPSVPALETDCNAICTGNVSELCGGTQRISYYEWTGDPLYVWHTPSGSAMGEYQYILDSPIVALISTPGINGKVQFVEKYGSSETPGSTGAYELDLFYEGDPSQAWRTMHVQSDVFCSASLIMPDKAGRQLNVGGWNYDSLWGLRMYWPDGSPGVPSINDWEEDYNEIHLLAARWYPSAMIMSNGSVFVIGGELASAGPPSPTLELLPFTGGGLVFFDWLNRTDPLNLYPFLCVLPSGGIFIQYYNEARILDPVTFNTIKDLPNVPGAVNNFLAGRTYPLAGSMMLLPQYAPYTDPLIILICGGSSPGGGGVMATDNCVTTKPDDDSPTWTIERMPSRRVMNCMVALPDGTYLIINGAQVGEAGFALAKEPNLQAVLYDPTLPLGARMSLMATTTIARLYHSEAALLQDGRVIVSGSDPQDARFPEEYRVELFYPPYTLNGQTKPSFTIHNKDWAYGEILNISIILPTGNAETARVSLIGASAQTHGNSMGQRTMFPACVCSTTSCTITAPPNSFVSPPGWFQLFLLDGPTPSNSTWVRIGGDPGELGNWPDLPGFTLPGV